MKVKYFIGEPYHIELTHTDSSPNNCPSSAKPNCDTPIHLSNYYHDEQAHNTHRQTTSNSFHFEKIFLVNSIQIVVKNQKLFFTKQVNARYNKKPTCVLLSEKYFPP